MEKQTFISAVEALHNQSKKDNINAEHLKAVFPDCDLLLYDNSTLSDALIDVLRAIMDDKDNWINYFIYELDFGAKNDKLKAWDKDGNNIPLSTPEDLYNLLVSSK